MKLSPAQLDVLREIAKLPPGRGLNTGSFYPSTIDSLRRYGLIVPGYGGMVMTDAGRTALADAEAAERAANAQGKLL